MSFSDYLKQFDISKFIPLIEKSTIADVKKIVDKRSIDIYDFAALLCEPAQFFLPILAAKARDLTIKRFGKTISFYAPLYLSNECDNVCVYCGYHNGRSIKRVTLTLEQVKIEAQKIKEIGFDSILLLTGESPTKADVHYIKDCVKVVKNYFTYVALEVYPMSSENYQILSDAGVSGLTVYQETYDKEVYKQMHLKGAKSDYQYRIDTPERAFMGGLRKVGIGALLGLSDWKYEALHLALHIDYLRKKYWRQEVSLSFPRINPVTSSFKIPNLVTDKDMIHLISVMRIYLDDVPFVISTREKADFRDKLIELAITHISAGSKTTPGGYAVKTEAQGQFDISDKRELKEMTAIVRAKGYDPVIKDWDNNFMGVSGDYNG